MKIFILEDNIERIKKFKRELSSFDLTVTTSYDEAVSLWTPSTFDVVFLDHDLGGRTSSDCHREPNVGCRFARHKKIELWKSLVFVHSLNESGRREIALEVNGTEVPFICINWDNLRLVLMDETQIRAKIDASIQ